MITSPLPTSAEARQQDVTEVRQAYGLRIRTSIPLSALALAADGPTDLCITRARVPGPLPHDSPRLVRFEGDTAYLAWPGIGRMRVSRDTVLVDPLTLHHELVELAILGPVLAAVLQLRGVPLLHGSAVSRDGKVVLMVGNKGAGKSTMAAAFCAAGWNLLTDDVIPLRLAQRTVEIIPGYPAVKLSALAERNLVDSSASPVGEGKRLVPLTGGHRTLPISRVLLLDKQQLGPPVHIKGGDAMTGMLAHAYTLKFGEDGLTHGQDSALFAACAQLASSARVERLRRPEGFDALRLFAAQFH